MIENLDVLPILLLGGVDQEFLRICKLFLFEQHPAHAVQVSRVAAVVVGFEPP